MVSVHTGCAGSAPQAGWGSLRGGGGGRWGQPRERQLTLGWSDRRLSGNQAATVKMERHSQVIHWIQRILKIYKPIFLIQCKSLVFIALIESGDTAR